MPKMRLIIVLLSISIITSCSNFNGNSYETGLQNHHSDSIDYLVENYDWYDSYYSLHSIESFYNLPEVKKRIHFSKINLELLNAAIFYVTNKERKIRNIQLFKHNPNLEKAAQKHSDNMVEYDYFSHISPVRGSESMKKRLNNVGVFGQIAENIATQFGIEYTSGRSVYPPESNNGYFSYSPDGVPILNHTYIGFAEVVVGNWMASEGHRRNILDINIKYLGVGSSHFKRKEFHNIDEFIVTQNFCSTITSNTK